MTVAETRGRFDHPEPQTCSTNANVTRSLLGYLALAGPFYVVVSLAQALARSGFNLTRDEWSLLALGRFGWIQVVNLIVTGAMTIAGAIGVRRALGRSADAGLWAPRLLVGYGVALVAAGIFRADPADGFPSGPPSGPTGQLSWHATLHVLSGSIGFGCLIALCFVFARRYTRRGQHRAAGASRVVGVVFAIAFAGIATGATSAAINLGFTAAVVASCAWMTAVAVDLYRGTRLEEQEQALSNE
ncbi:MAG: DUF998 domain-containing protein [Acidimicrobiales bacterium]